MPQACQAGIQQSRHATAHTLMLSKPSTQATGNSGSLPLTGCLQTSLNVPTAAMLHPHGGLHDCAPCSVARPPTRRPATPASSHCGHASAHRPASRPPLLQRTTPGALQRTTPGALRGQHAHRTALCPTAAASARPARRCRTRRARRPRARAGSPWPPAARARPRPPRAAAAPTAPAPRALRAFPTVRRLVTAAPMPP